MHVYCSYSGGSRAPSSSSPLTIGPSQSAEGCGLERGVELRGRVLVASLREACSCVEGANERETREKRSFQFGKRSGFRGVLGVVSKRARGGFEASERKRGCLNVESAFFGGKGKKR